MNSASQVFLVLYSYINKARARNNPKRLAGEAGLPWWSHNPVRTEGRMEEMVSVVYDRLLLMMQELFFFQQLEEAKINLIDK